MCFAENAEEERKNKERNHKRVSSAHRRETATREAELPGSLLLLTPSEEHFSSGMSLSHREQQWVCVDHLASVLS